MGTESGLEKNLDSHFKILAKTLIANLTNLTEVLVWLNGVLVWLTEVASLPNCSASLRVCSVHLSHATPPPLLLSSQICLTLSNKPQPPSLSPYPSQTNKQRLYQGPRQFYLLPI